jgi:Icc-related predicted phosphoesterase
VIRLAAIGDLHLEKDSPATILEGMESLAEDADVLLLAGDLTHHGFPEECVPLVRKLSRIPVPVVAVLGNHEYHQGAEGEIRRVLERWGIVVLEGERTRLEVRGQRVGIAGTKGFGGGFAGACAAEFGELEMKAFVRHTRGVAARFGEALESMDADVRIALTHYAPTNATLAGERPEIFPFLGSYLLGEVIDRAQCSLAIHGHAHRGVERGATAGGVPVRNVALPVIRRPYKVYCFTPGSEPGEAC